MKRILIITLLVFGYVSGASAQTNKKITELNETTDIQSNDLLALVDTSVGSTQRITAINLYDMINTSTKLAAIVTDETGTGVVVFGTSPALTTPAVAGATLTGVIDGGGADSIEITNGTGPTVDAAGEIAVDTDADGNLIDQGVITYYDGTQQMFGIAVDSFSGISNDDTIVYSATADKWVIKAQSGGGGGANDFSWTLEPQRAKLPTSNPMGIDAGNLRWRGLYDDTTDECAQWSTSLRPFQGGTLQAQVDYTLETTSTSDVVEFELYVMCVTGGSPEGDAQDVDSDSFGTVNDISSGSISSTAGRLVTLTDSSLNEDSCAEGDMIIIKICRDADDTDTTADDVELREVTIYE